MLFVVEERLEGLKCNIGLGGGMRVQKERLDMSTMQKEGHFMGVPLHFGPQCSFHKLDLRRPWLKPNA